MTNGFGKHYDLAIIGAGLSGSRFLISLVERASDLLRQGEDVDRPIDILLIDKRGEFGKGIPYGNLADRRYLLIEDLQHTRCPDFEKWVFKNSDYFQSFPESKFTEDVNWYNTNKKEIEANEYSAVYFPRHVFGKYAEEKLEAAITQGKSECTVNVTKLDGEVCDAIRLPGTKIRLKLDADSVSKEISANSVVISIGSMPKTPKSFSLNATASYLCDDVYCGIFDLTNKLEQFGKQFQGEKINVAILGSGASAIESIHTLANTSGVAERLSQVRVVSRSGMLPTGITSQLPSQKMVIGAYAAKRTSAEEYVATAKELLRQNKLETLAGQIVAVNECDDGTLDIEILNQSEAMQYPINVDLVINCLGSGKIDATSSQLVNNLAKYHPVRDDKRGFNMTGKYALAQSDNMFVLGPLLNEDNLETHVESISAVFKASDELAAQMLERILRKNTAELTLA